MDEVVAEMQALKSQTLQTLKENEVLIASLKAKLEGGELIKEGESSGSLTSIKDVEVELKMAKVREVENSLTYCKQHVKCKGERSYLSPLTSKSRKAGAPSKEGKGKSRGKKSDMKKPVHCFFAERSKGLCYKCN